MSKTEVGRWTSVMIVLAALLCLQVNSLSAMNLAGSVKSSDGGRVEGAAGSARPSDKTFRKTVYTNKNGEYYFPSLEAGSYKVWAQDIGYEEGIMELKLAAAGKLQQDFSLKPLQDFGKQMSSSEWLASLPVDTPEDRR